MTEKNTNDPHSPAVSIWTLGCKVNQYETQALKERFSSMGYRVFTDERDGEKPDHQDGVSYYIQPDKADIYIINTCTVTSLSDKKSRQYIRRARRKNPEAIIAVTGCFAQVSPKEAAAIEGVSIVAGTHEKHRLPELIEEYLDAKQKCDSSLSKIEALRKNSTGEKQKSLHPHPYITPWQHMTTYEDTGAIISMESRTRAFIKIEDGCDRFCSYCIIPYARGTVRSRRLSDIIEEAQNLISRGFKEIVLTGINAALYAQDTSKDVYYGNLQGIESVIAALNSLPGDFRIRLGSIEPTVIDRNYAEKLLKYEKLCPHMHLSLQSGSNNVLASMNRHYTQKEYLDILSALKNHDSGYGITTDIIAGFPGETEEDFAESVKIVNIADFCKVHVFPYSIRKGTKAALMPDQVSPHVKSIRSAELNRLGEEGSVRFFSKNIGAVRTVLPEEMLTVTPVDLPHFNEDYHGIFAAEGIPVLTGYTENYIKVYFQAESHLMNTFCQVKLTGHFRDGMKGEILSDTQIIEK